MKILYSSQRMIWKQNEKYVLSSNLIPSLRQGCHHRNIYLFASSLRKEMEVPASLYSHFQQVQLLVW